jgi:hypothetical protein
MTDPDIDGGLGSSAHADSTPSPQPVFAYRQAAKYKGSCLSEVFLLE